MGDEEEDSTFCTDPPLRRKIYMPNPAASIEATLLARK